MTWLIFLVAIAGLIGLAFYANQAHQAKISDFAESVRIRIKAQGGQDISVDKIDAPHLSGAILFAVGYTDVDGRQIMNRVTVHTVGEYKFKQFWGEPVTPV
ncbi:MAG: hypothetical protein AB8G95_21640 [Anaerolineae bacterium]